MLIRCSRLAAVVIVAVILAACTPGSYGLPESERSRTYITKPYEDVWAAAVDALGDIRATITDQRKQDGIITARTGFSITNTAGGEFRVVVSQRSDGVRVDASMQIPSWTGDLGESERKVKAYLAALDKRIR